MYTGPCPFLLGPSVLMVEYVSSEELSIAPPMQHSPEDLDYLFIYFPLLFFFFCHPFFILRFFM